ncbi:hypothetical protein HHK36_024577 [Tetracentron sinense]|uniref:Uncharacterized protein n=1 Tax=Tetracentron sinense TaxID=13715 RepID=A0A834YN93_TETSI|nr:hypothetical protein HHK36_024577 [Tetracentron sinense]
MPPTTSRSGPPILLVMLFMILLAIITPANCSTSEKLDESLTPGTPAPDSGIKCTPCNPQPPPPPPPAPRPPPPPKSPSKQNCPPPPPTPFIYIPSPPGNLYPVNPYFSGAGRKFVVGWPVLVGYGLLGGLLAFW